MDRFSRGCADYGLYHGRGPAAEARPANISYCAVDGGLSISGRELDIVYSTADRARRPAEDHQRLLEKCTVGLASLCRLQIVFRSSRRESGVHFLSFFHEGWRGGSCRGFPCARSGRETSSCEHLLGGSPAGCERHADILSACDRFGERGAIHKASSQFDPPSRLAL